MMHGPAEASNPGGAMSAVGTWRLRTNSTATRSPWSAPMTVGLTTLGLRLVPILGPMLIRFAGETFLPDRFNNRTGIV